MDDFESKINQIKRNINNDHLLLQLQKFQEQDQIKTIQYLMVYNIFMRNYQSFPFKHTFNQYHILKTLYEQAQQNLINTLHQNIIIKMKQVIETYLYRYCENMPVYGNLLVAHCLEPISYNDQQLGNFDHVYKWIQTYIHNYNQGNYSICQNINLRYFKLEKERCERCNILFQEQHQFCRAYKQFCDYQCICPDCVYQTDIIIERFNLINKEAQIGIYQLPFTYHIRSCYNCNNFKNIGIICLNCKEFVCSDCFTGSYECSKCFAVCTMIQLQTRAIPKLTEYSIAIPFTHDVIENYKKYYTIDSKWAILNFNDNIQYQNNIFPWYRSSQSNNINYDFYFNLDIKFYPSYQDYAITIYQYYIEELSKQDKLTEKQAKYLDKTKVRDNSTRNQRQLLLQEIGMIPRQ